MPGDRYFTAKDQLNEFFGDAVQKYVLKNSGHYMSDEAPEGMTEAIIR